jgi:hypothetical protein
MFGESDDEPTVGEEMNRELGLDPGFTLDHPSLVDQAREEQDDTIAESKAKSRPTPPKP